jgi:hypothetical protein
MATGDATITGCDLNYSTCATAITALTGDYVYSAADSTRARGATFTGSQISSTALITGTCSVTPFDGSLTTASSTSAASSTFEGGLTCKTGTGRDATDYVDIAAFARGNSNAACDEHGTTV